MRHIIFNTLFVTIVLFNSTGVTSSYSSNHNIGRIRDNSSRQDNRIYNKIAIDLVNGKANNISIDNMSRLLKNYNIVQFGQRVNSSVRGMITKEIAYRMIKNHYLPRLNDKIEVYRQSVELSKQVDLHVRQVVPYPVSGYKPSLILPLDYARIKEDKTVDTLHWPDMASQVSSAIENLWINRIQAATNEPAQQKENKALVAVLSELKLIYDNQGMYVSEAASEILKDNVLYQALVFIFESWQITGVISKENMPLLAVLLREYIILNSSDDLNKLARDVKGFKDLNSLHNALLRSIDGISLDIKQNNPSDYATLAMLQSMLSDISDKFSIMSVNADTSRPEIKPRYHRS